MKTIETDAVVTSEGQLNLHLNVNLAPGQYKVLVVVDEAPSISSTHRILDLHVIDVGVWPEHLSLRREDMYGDDGR